MRGVSKANKHVRIDSISCFSDRLPAGSMGQIGHVQALRTLISVSSNAPNTASALIGPIAAISVGDAPAAIAGIVCNVQLIVGRELSVCNANEI